MKKINWKIMPMLGCIWLASKVCPKSMLFIVGAFHNFLTNLPDQLPGRNGGIITVPWAVDEEGLQMALRLQKAATEECRDERARIASEAA